MPAADGVKWGQVKSEQTIVKQPCGEMGSAALFRGDCGSATAQRFIVSHVQAAL